MLSPTQGFIDKQSAQSVQFQVLPHNAEVEAALLGALLIDPDQMLEVGYLQADDFFITHHRKLYNALAKLFDRHQHYDLVTLCDWLEASGDLADFGGPAGISDIMHTSFLSMNAPLLAEIVYRDATRRRVIESCTKIVQSAYEFDITRSGQELVNQAVSSLVNIDAVRGITEGPQNMGAAIEGLFDQVEAVQNGGLPGLQTGIKDIDQIFGGFQKDKSYLLAGRPGMGKSGLALQIAHNLAKQDKRILIFSLEMSKEDQAARLVSQISEVPYAAFQSGQVPDWSKVIKAMEVAKNLPITIDDTPALTTTAIRNISQKEAAKHGLDLLIIDHVGIIRSDIPKANPYQQSSKIADEVMAMSKQLGVPILSLSQLSRDVEKRDNKRPRISDLRDSGKWEENGDGIIFIYRDEVYNPDTEFPSLAEIIIAKNRGGKTGAASVYADKTTARFESLHFRQAND